MARLRPHLRRRPMEGASVMKRTLCAAVCLFGIVLLALPAAAQKAKSPRAVLEAYVAAWNSHDTAAFDKLLAPDAVHEDISAGVHAQGPDAIKAFFQDEVKSQPDLHWQITRVIESGPRLAAEWTWHATYTGDTPNGPVTNLPISGRGVSVALVENGRLKHLTDYYDGASFFPKKESK